jgi:serine/threonine-protein kinase RsbW
MDQSFEITIGSDNAEIPAVLTLLEVAMHAHGFKIDDILDTQLAVEEVITNTIVHGYKKAGGEIIISCQINLSNLEVRIKDSAPRFDPLSIPNPKLDGAIEERKIGGLGVYLVRQVMDKVFYQYENGKNILVLIKRRTG